MDEKTASTSVSAEQLSTVKDPNMAATEKAVAFESATTTTSSGERKAYGTAKTENLRDSGAWRIILPTFVILACLGLLAVPLIILVNLLATSLDVSSAANKEHISLTWLWITMIVVELGLAAVIIWGLLKIFLTQAGNYRR